MYYHVVTHVTLPRESNLHMRSMKSSSAVMSDKIESIMSKISEKKCPMCSFEAPTVRLVLAHLRSVHSNDPRFNVMCGIDGCARTYRKYSGLHSHLYRSHWSTSRDNSQSLASSGVSTEADCMELNPLSSGFEPLTVCGKYKYFQDLDFHYAHNYILHID